MNCINYFWRRVSFAPFGLIVLLFAACVQTPVEDGNVFPTVPSVTLEPTAVSQITPTVPPTLEPTPVATAVPPTALPIPTATPMPPPDTPPQTPIRIQFEQGAVSATINGRVEAGQRIDYLAWANAGQTMQLEVVSNNSVANFSIVGNSDGQPYKRIINEDRFWEGELTQAQDYLIGLHALKAVDFTMNLTITTQPDVFMPVWPVVDAEYGTILGGSHNEVWLDSMTVMNSINDVERPYRIHGREGERGGVTGSLPYLPLGPCHGQPYITMIPNAEHLRHSVATIATWEVMPRQPEELPRNTAVYLDEVRALLAANTVGEPIVEPVNLVSIDRIDLEGDGIDEVLIHASNLTGLGNGLPNANAGDYSLLILRKVVNGEVLTVPLLMEIYPERVDLANPSQLNMLGYFDLNGNGRLEFVVELLGYEHRFVHVFEAQPTGAKIVLSGGCSL